MVAKPHSNPISLGSALPNYLSARMINEYVYCPRLFYFEQVEGIFVHNEHTTEGKVQHKRVDKESRSVPRPDGDSGRPAVVRSITLSSEKHRVIAKLDLVEFEDGCATPVDYKHGRPKRGKMAWKRGRRTASSWPFKRSSCEPTDTVATRASSSTRRRGRECESPFDDKAITEAEDAITSAWETAGAKEIPAPLVDSPKCPGCSLVGICMPDETWYLQSRNGRTRPEQLPLFDGVGQTPPESLPRGARLLVTPRSDRRPLYLNSPGLRVGKSGGLLRVREKNKIVQDVRINEINQVNLMGNIQITTQAIQQLCRDEKPICYFSQSNWFYGVTTGLNTKNVLLRKAQFRLAEEDWFCRRVASRLVEGKIRNQRTMLLRNHVEPPRLELRQLKRLMGAARAAGTLDELLGIEGLAARIYFSLFNGMLKRGGEWDGKSPFHFEFRSRNRRPPRDPVNALLSLGYSLLTKDLTVTCYAVGFDPMVGFYHQPRHGRPALALDLMEPLRPLVVDSAVLSAVNTRMISERDFVLAGRSVSLTAAGRKNFFRAYESRMDTLVTHPLFGYRTSYRRLLEIQARLLAKTLEGELSEYPVFVTR